MPEPLSAQIMQRTDEVAGLYHRLVLVVGPTGTGKTASLQAVAARVGTAVLNVNLELTRRMLDLTERQRALRVPRLLSEIVSAGQAEAGQSDVILLDNIEVLFDISLMQDPLRLLQGLSRNTTLVVAWNGSIEGQHLVYATPGHREYKRYSTRDLIVVNSVAAA